MKHKIIFFIIFFFFIFCAINITCIEGLTPKYDADNTDTPYHKVVSDSDPLSGTWLLNNGKLQFVPWIKIKDSYTYYDSEMYKYGATSYVPSYKDSIYLGIINQKTKN